MKKINIYLYCKKKRYERFYSDTISEKIYEYLFNLFVLE